MLILLKAALYIVLCILHMSFYQHWCFVPLCILYWFKTIISDSFEALFYIINENKNKNMYLWVD